MLDVNSLKEQFTGIDFREKRPDLYKILLPFFYEDGDMYDLFVEESPVNRNLIRISDYGLTLMKLSYNFELDTQHKNDVFQTIIMQNRCNVDNGNIYLDITPAQFTMGIYSLAQVISKVSNMDIISRESLQSCFMELLGNFLETSFQDYSIKKNISPVNNPDLQVDYAIESGRRPIYLFGVNDNTKASRVIITCLKFQSLSLPYTSLVIYEDVDKLNRFNQRQLTDAADKQFTSLDTFKEKGPLYLQRELSC